MPTEKNEEKKSNEKERKEELYPSRARFCLLHAKLRKRDWKSQVITTCLAAVG